MFFNTCPRCGDASLEHLKTHSYCFNCNYSPEDEEVLSERLTPNAIKSNSKTHHELETHYYSSFEPSPSEAAL